MAGTATQDQAHPHGPRRHRTPATASAGDGGGGVDGGSGLLMVCGYCRRWPHPRAVPAPPATPQTAKASGGPSIASLRAIRHHREPQGTAAQQRDTSCRMTAAGIRRAQRAAKCQITIDVNTPKITQNQPVPGQFLTPPIYNIIPGGVRVSPHHPLVSRPLLAAPVPVAVRRGRSQRHKTAVSAPAT